MSKLKKYIFTVQFVGFGLSPVDAWFDAIQYLKLDKNKPQGTHVETINDQKR